KREAYSSSERGKFLRQRISKSVLINSCNTAARSGVPAGGRKRPMSAGAAPFQASSKRSATLRSWSQVSSDSGTGRVGWFKERPLGAGAGVILTSARPCTIPRPCTRRPCLYYDYLRVSGNRKSGPNCRTSEHGRTPQRAEAPLSPQAEDDEA